MPSRRNNAEHHVASDDMKPDALSDYRAALASLNAAAEKLATLRALENPLRLDAVGVAGAKEKLLSASVRDTDDQETVEELGRLRSRAELFERKIADVTGRIIDTEAEHHALVSQTSLRFAMLWRAFRLWTVEQEVGRLKEGLAISCSPELLQSVALCSHAAVGIKKLEITGAEDATSLMAAAGRLLEAIEHVSGFALPPWQASTPAASVASADTVGLPYADRGWSVRQLEEEFAKIRLEDPALDYSAAYRVMRQRHPQLFSPPSQTEPVFETPKQEWKVPMIGDTVPV